MNQAMIIEIIVFAVILISGLVTSIILKRKLREYDGMGEVKREVQGRKPAPRKIL